LNQNNDDQNNSSRDKQPVQNACAPFHDVTSFSSNTHKPFNTARGVKQFDLLSSALVFSLTMILTSTMLVFVASLTSIMA
jgi:hypothetical protein